jgi:NAD(P)-dependent dehydrogenase (short-subunit alcohol dehydrogenase family)
LAQELKPFGIKVLIVEPGAFRTDLAGSAMKHMPEIGGYEGTVGGMRKFAHSMDGTQAGDPRKAAHAIEQVLDSAETPLRFQLGEDAIKSIRTHAEKLLVDMARWEQVSVDTNLSAARMPRG